MPADLNSSASAESFSADASADSADSASGPLRGADGLLERIAGRSLLRFATIGSVDDGKSTLIGRLLHDTGNIHLDHLEGLRRDTRATVGEAQPLDLSLLTDGLKAEREQGITIDVAYRSFTTERRHFIIADIPGHEQYTRNMATGASTAQLAIILVDAQAGVVRQTKRHAFIASLLGIPRLLVAVNKMDRVGFSSSRFEEVREQFADFATRLGITELKFVPISALEGDNVVTRSERLDWYRGETVLETLENVYVGGDRNLVDFRFPVQIVLRGTDGARAFAGRVASGRIRVGEEILVLPSRRRSTIAEIQVGGEIRETAFAGQSAAVTLDDPVDITRGDLLVRPNNVPTVGDRLEAMLIWLNETPSHLGRTYEVHLGPRTSRGRIAELSYRVDVETLSREKTTALALNDIGRVTIRTTEPMLLDPYRANRETGRFILIDPATGDTVGAGMLIDRRTDRSETAPHASSSTSEIHRHEGSITEEERSERAGHPGVTLWFSGLSGAGKSTITAALERHLFDHGCQVTRLDGDNLRSGLNEDLGFDRADRGENIRRVAQVAKLFNEAGSIALAALICPFEEDRTLARKVIGSERMISIHVTAPLEVCEERDPKGLYRKARAGEIERFTGVSDRYETPENPDLVLDTSDSTVEECVAQVVELLEERRVIARP